MTIHLPEDLEQFVQTKVQSGRFASEEEAITAAVRLLRQSEDVNGEKTAPAITAPEPAWQRIVKSMEKVPDAVFDRIPPDSSEQLDHYIYGSPRRPTS